MKEPTNTGPPDNTPLKIATEHELRGSIRQICRRLDANPHISQLLFVNPILVLQDVGVELSPQVREHVINALRFPPKRRARIAELEDELECHCRERGMAWPIQSDAASSPELAQPLAELARLRQGAMVFFPKAIYEQYKRGEKKHRWIKSIRFGICTGSWPDERRLML